MQKKSGIMKSGLDAMSLFLLDDLLSDFFHVCLKILMISFHVLFDSNLSQKCVIFGKKFAIFTIVALPVFELILHSCF